MLSPGKRLIRTGNIVHLRHLRFSDKTILAMVFPAGIFETPLFGHIHAAFTAFFDFVYMRMVFFPTFILETGFAEVMPFPVFDAPGTRNILFAIKTGFRVFVCGHDECHLSYSLFSTVANVALTDMSVTLLSLRFPASFLTRRDKNPAALDRCEI